MSDWTWEGYARQNPTHVYRKLHTGHFHKKIVMKEQGLEQEAKRV
jgi:hypothetical protein